MPTRHANSHDRSVSKRNFSAAVKAAERTMLDANDQLANGQARLAIGNLLRSAYWLGVAETERQYAGGGVNLVDVERLLDLNRSMPQWPAAALGLVENPTLKRSRGAKGRRR